VKNPDFRLGLITGSARRLLRFDAIRQPRGLPEPEIIAAHAVLGLEMADDGSTADLRRNSRLICGVPPRVCPREIPKLVIGRRVVAAISLVGEDARDGVADERLHVRNHRGQRVAVIWITGTAPSRVSDERSNTSRFWKNSSPQKYW
jgi:hypothetical protein